MRSLIICIYICLSGLSVIVALQARKLALCFPSSSWTVKRWIMVYAAVAQIYAVWRVLVMQVEPTIFNAITPFNWLLVMSGIWLHNWLLLRDYQRLRRKA